MTAIWFFRHHLKLARFPGHLMADNASVHCSGCLSGLIYGFKFLGCTISDLLATAVFESQGTKFQHRLELEFISLLFSTAD